MYNAGDVSSSQLGDLSPTVDPFSVQSPATPEIAPPDACIAVSRSDDPPLSVPSLSNPISHSPTSCDSSVSSVLPLLSSSMTAASMVDIVPVLSASLPSSVPSSSSSLSLLPSTAALSLLSSSTSSSSFSSSSTSSSSSSSISSSSSTSSSSSSSISSSCSSSTSSSSSSISSSSSSSTSSSSSSSLSSPSPSMAVDLPALRIHLTDDAKDHARADPLARSAEIDEWIRTYKEADAAITDDSTKCAVRRSRTKELLIPFLMKRAQNGQFLDVLELLTEPSIETALLAYQQSSFAKAAADKQDNALLWVGYKYTVGKVRKDIGRLLRIWSNVKRAYRINQAGMEVNDKRDLALVLFRAQPRVMDVLTAPKLSLIKVGRAFKKLSQIQGISYADWLRVAKSIRRYKW